MEHTKGEWRFNGRDIVVGQNIGQQRICTLIEHRKEYKVEDEANARLIAAAPDLLVACKNALADFEGIMPEYEPSGERQHPGWLTLSELRTTITKAEKD